MPSCISNLLLKKLKTGNFILLKQPNQKPLSSVKWISTTSHWFVPTLPTWKWQRMGEGRAGWLVYQIKGCISRMHQPWATLPKYNLEALNILSEYCSTCELEPQTEEHYRIMPFWNECCFLLTLNLILHPNIQNTVPFIMPLLIIPLHKIL